MPALDQLAAYHGLLIALALLAAGAGLPLPMMPMLLAAGALAGAGKVNFAAALLFSPLCLAFGDILWFFLGKHYGHIIVGLVCRISLERDVCIRKTQETFTRRGLPVLLFSRFVLGISALAPPMAGVTGQPLAQFLLYDLAGAFIYTCIYIILGYAFASQFDAIVQIITDAGVQLSLAVLILFAAYAAFKLLTRYWLIRQAATLAIPAQAAHDKLSTHPALLVVDLRGPADLAADPFCIPGAKLWRERELLAAVETSPRETPILLYCACPNEATSTRVALTLRRKGFHNVWPLRHGLAGWRAAGLPLEASKSPALSH